MTDETVVTFETFVIDVTAVMVVIDETDSCDS